MTTLGLFLLLVGSVGGATIHDTLRRGLCLCVADNDIYARDGPGEEHKVLAVLHDNDCFVTKGGFLHIFGATWYELLNVQNEVGWVNAYHLRVKNMTECTGTPGSVSSTPFSITGGDPFAGGDPFQAGTCTEGGMLYRDGDHIQRGGVTCTCRRGVIDCPSSAVG
ncbi:uncharacterized protein LOC133195438 [Saccostrea echinata]|uniref:uncharacterized protein LOC133195438 n=1 Tax=Saccostrea echinata TaxID=191078 RepID=UPI002A807F89|nr:uncharacterized protein LOC133195438 [Saccostrea echinata]